METECIPYWKIDVFNVGVCRKCNPETLICSDSGKRCPYGGVRDFERLYKKEKRRLREPYERGTRASIGAPRRPWGSQKGRRVA